MTATATTQAEREKMLDKVEIAAEIAIRETIESVDEGPDWQERMEKHCRDKAIEFKVPFNLVRERAMRTLRNRKGLR